MNQYFTNDMNQLVKQLKEFDFKHNNIDFIRCHDDNNHEYITIDYNDNNDKYLFNDLLFILKSHKVHYMILTDNKVVEGNEI